MRTLVTWLAAGVLVALLLGALLWVPVRVRRAEHGWGREPAVSIVDKWSWSWSPDAGAGESARAATNAGSGVDVSVRWAMLSFNVALVASAGAAVLVLLSGWRPGGSIAHRRLWLGGAVLLFLSLAGLVYVPKEGFLSRDPADPALLDRTIAECDAGTRDDDGLILMYRLAATPGGRRTGWTVGNWFWIWDSSPRMYPGGMFSEERVVWWLVAPPQFLFLLVGSGVLAWLVRRARRTDHLAAGASGDP